MSDHYLGDQKFIFYIERNYSTLDKELWPLFKELKVHSLPRTHYSTLENEFWPFTGDTREGSLAIDLDKEVWSVFWGIKVHSVPRTQLLNLREKI